VNAKFGAVTVKVAPPAGLDAKKRRLSAAVKAKLAVQALRAAYAAALTVHDAAYGKLKGAEVTEYSQLLMGNVTVTFNGDSNA
jgi:hypothetical protein